MAATVTICDTTMFNAPADGWTLDLPTECITVRELIRTRVEREVQAHNAEHPHVGYPPVPSADEQRLNGVRLAKRPQLNPERQFERALAMWESNGLFVLVDEQQVDDLDAVIEIGPATSVTFLKLVPLVGG